MIVLRHQIAVLKRSGTGRPCFRLRDRLFWLLLVRWWPGWRDSLVIVQPATVLRWRRSASVLPSCFDGTHNYVLVDGPRCEGKSGRSKLEKIPACE